MWPFLVVMIVCLVRTCAFSNVTQNTYFVQVDGVGGATTTVVDGTERILRFPHFVTVFDSVVFLELSQADGPRSVDAAPCDRPCLSGSTACQDESLSHHKDQQLKRMGSEARELIDKSLESSGAILFRSLNTTIQSAQDFKTFWNACLSTSTWTPMSYMPSRGNRKKMDGIDTATGTPPETIHGCHNEMAYNPKPAGKIAFYCLHGAKEGGETILVRNRDLTDILSAEIKDYVVDHGGFRFERRYYDETKPKPEGHWDCSWQDRCDGVETLEEAEQFFRDLGFQYDEIIREEDGNNLIITNTHPGFLKGGKPHYGWRVVDEERDEKPLWFSWLDLLPHLGFVDGDQLPSELQQELKTVKWNVTYSIKLEPGDWVILDNLQVQHGRLHYVADPERLRTILVVYTD